MKIFAFVASCAVKDSNTAKMADTIAEAIRKRAEESGETVTYEKVTGAEIRIDYCRSCSNCFVRGVCPLDGKDDMAMLKEKILDCDIFLFGTPVYIWEMSGLAKSFLDRISYWTHRLELMGKPCVVFSTTSASHGPEVTAILEELMPFTGALVINGGYSTLEGLKCDVDETARKAIDVYRDPVSNVSAFAQQAYLSRVILTRRYLKKHSEDDEIIDEMKVTRDRGITKYVLMKEAIEALFNEPGGFYYREKR